MAISPHIARLRALVGHEVLQLPSVAVLVVDDDGRVLLVRHADTGVWGVLGGAIELDEAPDAAAVREVAEEVGLDVTLERLVGVFSGPEYRVEYPNGDQASYVVAAYEAAAVSGEPVPDGEETTEAAWFDLESDVPAPLNDLAAALLRDTGLTDPSRRASSAS